MMRRVLAMACAVAALSATAAVAGTGYTMKCSSCGFSSQVNIGGGMGFEQITGFCVDSMKFVYLQWKRGEKKPEPAARIWDSTTGKKIDLYKCPDGDGLFMPLLFAQPDAEGPGFDRCPKCGKPTFRVDKSKPIMMYD